jgi:hypothetical protein
MHRFSVSSPEPPPRYYCYWFASLEEEKRIQGSTAGSLAGF